MSQLWIKICGITRNSDAIAAVGSGADAIGLVFYGPSPRSVTRESIEEITSGIDGRARVIALFVNPSATEVDEVLASNRIDMLQFHGAEPRDFCESFGVPYLKAFSVKGNKENEISIDQYPSAAMLLLDSYSEKAPGGTGKIFDWDIARSIVEKSQQKIVVAGGLNPDNVQTAVAKINPFGVDVSSGVEQSHGIKDLDKVSAFIEGARSV